MVTRRKVDRLSLECRRQLRVISKWIVFHSNVDGNFEIYLIDADGTNLTRVTNYPGLDQFPEWSPNGKQLAIRRDTDIYLIDIDGTNPIRLTHDAPVDQMASWSPSGRQIAFMSFREGYCSVFVMNSDGSDPTNLTPKPDAVPAAQFCSRAPGRSEEHTSELQSLAYLVCRLLLEKKKN